MERCYNTRWSSEPQASGESLDKQCMAESQIDSQSISRNKPMHLSYTFVATTGQIPSTVTAFSDSIG